MPAARPPFRAACLSALIAWCVYAATTGGSFATDLASYEVTRALVEERSVAMRYNVLDTEHERGPDGRFYAPVGIGHPVFGIPFYLGARAAMAAGLRAGKPESLTKAAVVFGSTVAAAGCVFFSVLLGWFLSGDRRAAVTAGLLVAFATPLWVYSKFGFNAPLAALALTASAAGICAGARANHLGLLVAGGVALGCGVLTRHEMVFGFAPAALYLAIVAGDRRRRLRWLLAAGAPVAVAAGLWMWYNAARFGHPLDTGLLRDPNVRLDTPIVIGLHGLLLSPGRSLLVYAPVTIAGVAALWALRRAMGPLAIYCGSTALLFLLLIAKMHQWDGGESYGPRYLVPILPFVTLPVALWLRPTAPRRARRIVGVLAVAGLLVQVPGVLVDFNKAQLAFARSRADYSIALTRYTWDGAPLSLNTRVALVAVPENARYLAGLDTPPVAAATSDESDRGFSQQFAFSLDFWWLYLFYLGALPRWAAIAAPLVLGAAAAWLGHRLLGHLRRDDGIDAAAAPSLSARR
ncbi:MAG TPA: hypothetical protein VMM93_11935 [Vicinamibacterales bacterium]|nr:hypothetical protein [Vicinamibacterales bacterium]